LHIADANANGNAAESYTHGYRHINANRHTKPDTYGVGYGYTYRHGNAKLHAKLRIYIGDRSHRAGSHRHRKPLR
jgi:hypothetical protein